MLYIFQSLTSLAPQGLRYHIAPVAEQLALYLRPALHSFCASDATQNWVASDIQICVTQHVDQSSIPRSNMLPQELKEAIKNCVSFILGRD